MPQLLSSTALDWYQQVRPSRPEANAVLGCIHVAVEQQAARTPQKAVLVDESGHLSYADLSSAVHLRAAALLQRCRGEPGPACVGVLLENGMQKIITYFACLKAGLVYAPLEHHPPAVMERILEQVPLRVLVSHKRFEADLPAACRERLEMFWVEAERRIGIEVDFPELDPLRTAHLAFTTGTRSGIPKAVATNHVGSMLAHEWRSRLWPGDAARDVVGCNIFGIWDVVPALCHGIPVVLISDETMRDPLALASCIIRYGITRLMMTPTLLGACLASGEGIDGLRRLRLLVLCGEVVVPAVAQGAREALRNVRIANLYSLAECHDVAAGELTSGRDITSGWVADFAEVHLCEAENRDRLVPLGEAGRVLVGGRALALGYYDDPERSAERFVEVDLPTPDGGCRRSRVYDSGDLGIFHPNGALEILGRCDTDLKIRGSWVDPSQIERVVEQHPLVGRACVVAATDRNGQVELSAFVVPREAQVQPASLAGQLRPYLASRLPQHSVPSRFALVGELPLLPSGKVDRKRLQRLEQALPSPLPARREMSDLEQQVLSAFRETLDDPTIGPHDDFHARGGHSLRAIVLCGALQRSTGRRLAVRDVYLHPSPSTLVRFLQAQRDMPERPSWRRPELDPDIALRPGAFTGRPERPRTVLLTGVTGFLGASLADTLLAATSVRIAALVRAEDAGHACLRLEEAFDQSALTGLRKRNIDARLQVIPGDLSRPLMGLAPEAFAALAGDVDGIFHLAAELDMFAGYDDVERVNVGGTREVLRLAFHTGVPVHCVSSSAVFPLDGQKRWPETTFGQEAMQPLAADLEASGADGYSLSKFSAELLIWSAFERGLPVSVVRVPHLLGHSEKGIWNDRDRLLMTVRALVEVGAFPEGDWTWQFAPMDAVCQELVSHLQTGPSRDEPVRHIALEPLCARQILAALRAHGIELEILTLPALVHAMIAAARPGAAQDAVGYQAVCAVAQLILQHGPRAALSLSDAQLMARRPSPTDPEVLFRSVLGRMT